MILSIQVDGDSQLMVDGWWLHQCDQQLQLTGASWGPVLVSTAMTACLPGLPSRHSPSLQHFSTIHALSRTCLHQRRRHRAETQSKFACQRCWNVHAQFFSALSVYEAAFISSHVHVCVWGVSASTFTCRCWKYTWVTSLLVTLQHI